VIKYVPVRAIIMSLSATTTAIREKMELDAVAAGTLATTSSCVVEGTATATVSRCVDGWKSVPIATRTTVEDCSTLSCGLERSREQ
jgi:hypothetical protein